MTDSNEIESGALGMVKVLRGRLLGIQHDLRRARVVAESEAEGIQLTLGGDYLPQRVRVFVDRFADLRGEQLGEWLEAALMEVLRQGVERVRQLQHERFAAVAGEIVQRKARRPRRAFSGLRRDAARDAEGDGHPVLDRPPAEDDA